jgi:hypothetical protein
MNGAFFFPKKKKKKKRETDQDLVEEVLDKLFFQGPGG